MMKRQGSKTAVIRRFIAGMIALCMGVLAVGTAAPVHADETPVFTSVWDTTLTSEGSSDEDQIKLPLTSNGVYDFTVDWGDGTTPDQINSWDDAAATHTFITPGPQTISITGTIEGFGFANAGDRLKLTDVTEWGPLLLGNDGGYFYGAASLNITAVDAPDLSATTNMQNAFRNATSLTKAPLVGVENPVETGGLKAWDVSQVRDMRSMFQGATGFVADISGWDVGRVTSMRSMFQGATAFDSDISSWNVGNVATMRSMFEGAEAFDRNLGAWDVSSVEDLTSMFAGGEQVGLSLDNYSALLQGWSQLVVQPALDFDAGNSFYNPTTAGTARAVLTDTFEWTINDAGAAGVPARPSAPTAAAGAEMATVTWVEPAANNSAITSYTVTSTPGNFTCTVDAPALTCDVTGLTNLTAYTFKVTAANAVGTSEASPASNTVVPDQTAPSAPAKPFAEALNESARIYVSPGTGGVPVTYDVTASPGPGTCQVTVPATSCVITGLTNGTSYTFTATATNADGTSGPSPASNAITPGQPFSTVWDTTKVTNGSSNASQIRLPLVSDGTYNFNVSWGDGTGGTVTSANDPDATHTYASSGVKTVTITGTLRGFNFGANACNVWGQDQNTDRNKLTDVTNWGSVRLDTPTKQSNYFCWAQNLEISATTSPDLTATTSLKGAFYGAQKLNSSLASWDTSNITNMSQMFYNASLYNQSLNAWDTSSVTNMSQMFTNASAYNQPMSSWNTAAVTDMGGMFQSAVAFNQSLATWNTASVTDFNRMFNGATVFNGDVSTWNTGSGTDFSYMFSSAAAFNANISAWNTASATTLQGMFNGSTVFNANISGWNTGNVITMQQLFQNARAFNQDLSAWDVSKVLITATMFNGASAMNSPLDGWGAKTASFINTSNMFLNATSFNQPIGSWDTGNVTSMAAMFSGATAFDQDLNSWDTSNVTSMASMFLGASVFDGDITAWDTGAVTTFESFAENARLFNHDIGNWNTTSVTTMKSMFKGATVFNQDLRSWDMGGVTTAAEMFSSAALSTANYNKMLYSWAYGQSTDGVENGRGTGVVTDNVVFSAGAADYSVGAPTEARAILVGRGWSITDGGQTDSNVPNPPTAVNANRVDNVATVSWTPPATANPGVSSYEVRAFITTNETMALEATDLGCSVSGASSTSCDVEGLAGDKSYLFDVVAINSFGASDPSQMQQPDVPAAPIAQSRFEAAKVGWITPPTVGGDPLSYTITASPGGATCTITLPLNTCTVEGLSNSQAYTFTATATNALGTSTASDASAAITPGAAFVSTWRTQNTGTSATNQIKLPLESAGTYNFNVSWGDGTTDNITTWNDLKTTHTYPARGDYDVTITGDITGWRFANSGDKEKLVDISRWGPLRLGNNGAYFQGATQLNVTAPDALDLTGTTNLTSAFHSASKFNGAIGNWDVSNVTTMANMFLGATSFNQPLNDWGAKTSNVTDMSRMFYVATKFNQPINSWNVSSVTTFYQMFYSALQFNGSVSGWAPSSATNMQQMFGYAYKFNQPIDWTATASVTNMQQMFTYAYDFNQSLASLNTSSVTNMNSMFSNATDFNGDVSTWNTANVTNMASMFTQAASFNNASGLSAWNTGNVTSMASMFSYAPAFNQPLATWNTGKVTDMSVMFQYAPAFNQPLNAWDVSKVTNMSRMFEGASTFNQDLNSWNTGNVAGGGMTYMFYLASDFDGQVSNWNTSKVTDFSWLFRQASAFNQDVSGWDTSSVTNFTDTFRSTRFRGDVTSWNVTKATTMSGMFSSITPDSDVSGLRGTPWLNRTLIAWSQQAVRPNVTLNFSDTGGGGFPKYTAGAYSLGSEAAYDFLTRSTAANPNPGKGWNIQTGGTTAANTPGQPLNLDVNRSGAEDNGADAVINWSKPVDGDTASPLTYRVEATTDSNVGCTVSPALSPDSQATTCSISGMTVNVFYQFTVTAVNSTGDSEPSDPPLPTQNIGPLTPALGTPTPTPDGFTVPITNYNGQYQWSGTATQNGSVTVADGTGIATIRGVAPDTTSIATITASRFAYTDQSSTVSGTSLKAALNPAFETPVRTPDGFTAKITNYDGVNYGWAATALPGPGTATIVEVSGEHFLRVTDLLPNVEATVTVSTTRDGYAPGSTEVVDSSLRSALTPTFGPAEATANGFSAVITNYDDQYTWAATLPDGSPGVVEIVEDEENNTHSVVVSGLDPAVTVTTTVTASRTDSVQGSATVTDTSLDEALVPTLGTPQPTATGFTVEITNYDNAWTFTGTATADGTVTVNGAIATVTGVAPDTESEVTITSHRDDYANGQATTSATSLKAALVPDLQSPVSTPDGYTMMINNYDSPTYTWVATVTSAEGSASIQAVEGGHAVVVVGLDPDDPATVVVTTNRAGYATGSVERTASSLKAKLDPTFGPVVRTDDGFTAQITNYDSPTYAWNLATSAGSVSRQSDGGSEFVVVTGLPPNTSATVTVTTTREGYAGGSNTVSGTSLLAAYTPELGDAVATASGFTSEIENYDDSYTWNPSITTDPVPQGASVSITLVEGVHYVTVTGMAANTAATVEVTTTLTNHATGEASVSGTSLLAALTPSLAPAVKTNGGFTSVISNYDPAYTWGASSTSGTATITSNGGVFSVTVSGLGTEATATATVTTTRDGYASGSAQVTSTSNKDALTPAFGPVVRTAGGFTSQITNYDDDYQWGESTSAGTVWIAEEGGLFYVQVTGLAANTPATATITTSREGYANGSNTVTGTSLMAALTPDLAAPVATPDGFTAQIENYNADYVWNASITSDPIPQGATASITQNGSDYFVTVTGLAPNTEATATVTATRTNYITGSAAVSDTSLLAKLVPAFEEAVQTPNGFTAVISNYDGAYVWDASVNLPSPAQASITNVGAVYSVTVSGLDPATSAVATVTTEREGYADGSAELADSSQQVALEPELATPTRTAGGFTALITNYDDDFDWDATIKDGTPVGAAAAITESGSDHFLTVTGLAPNTDATAIVTTTQDGYVPGAEEVTATSLLAARTPTFGPTVQTDDGFTAAITNYDGDFVWDASITSMPVPGGATAEVDEVSGTHYLIVSGLAADVTVTATVTATQDDYAPGSAAVIASSLKSALTPEFGTITRTDGGFTVPVTNYDDAFDWPATWNGGSTEVGSDGVLVVTGLADSEEVTVTVEAVQDGYVTGSNTVIGEAAETELTPEFGTPTATDGGFTVPVTNYSGDYVWNLSATAGTAVLNTSGNPVLVVVTGLSVGQSSTVTATTTRTNYITGSNTVTGMSLQASLTPTFGAVSRTPEGFTALITNYNSDYVWDASSTVGDAEVVGDGQTASVVVTNVPTGGATATATVTTTRTGYFDGSANVTGRSTLAALTPQFATPERGVNGFTVQITNYDPDYTWSADLENGLPAGASAAMTTQGPNHFVTVTGLADGADATAIVTTVVPGDLEVNASAGVESAALDAPLVPTFGTAVPTDGGFTVPITNYSGDYEWDLSPSAGSASIDTSGTPTLVVTGLSVGQTSVVTVTTTQEGFQDGSAQATGMSLQAAFNPTFGAVTRTDGGFTAPISNYVAGFTMIASMDPDIQDASAVVSGSGVLTVTGLPDGQQIQVTVATSQAGYFDGTGTVNGAALDAAYNPEFENVTATNDGFTAEVSNYEAGYEWSVEADPGTASINYDANPVLLTVTGLTTGQSSTVTVGTTKSTSLPGAGSVTGTATQEALTPAFGTVVRNETGFTVPITNYSEDFTWNANATEGTASVVPVDATTANLVVTNLPGSELSTVTVTTNRTGFFGGSAQVTGRSTLKARTPVLGEPVRDVEKFTVEIDNYDPDYEWVATIQTGGPAGAVADIDEVSGTHYAVVTGLADGEEATVVVTTTAIGAPSVTASATKTSSALNAAWVPAFGVVTPTDGGFTIEITNYDDDFDWTPVAAPGSASIDTSDQVDLLVVTGLGVGQESTVTVTTTRSGYQTGSAQETGTSLQAAFNPTFGTVTRTDGGFTVPITNYVAGFTLTPSMDPVVQDAEAEVSDSGVLTVTGLPAGQQVQVTIATAQTGYFNGTGTVEGAALNAALPPVLGTPIPGNRSITVPIDNYDELYSWTPSATVGTAVVNTEMSPVSIVVTGLGPEETTLVNVVTTREGYLSATLAEPVEGTSDTGGQLNPVFGTTVATGDGLIAPITNYDPDFTWAASSSFGDAEVVEGEGDESGTWFLVVTGVDPVTSVVATVTTTRPKYDQGSASTSATTLKAALVPQTQNPSALSGAYTVEIAGYTSAYQWRAETDSGEWPIDDQGLVRVTGLTPGQTETLRIYSVRPGYGVGVTELTIAPLNAALTPQFSGYTPVLGGFSTQITNYDSAYTWTASASPGQATVNSAGLVTVTGLGSGTGSTVTVTASRTGYESGTSSSTGKALVQIPPAAPPSAPRVVQVKAVSGGKAKVTWAPTSYGGAPIDNAKATCKAGSSKKHKSGTAKTLTVAKLKKGKKYTCTVKVENIFGWSATSNKVKVKAK